MEVHVTIDRMKGSSLAVRLVSRVFIILGLWSLVSAGWAIEYFVSPSGSDKNLGTTLELPFLSIAKGLRKLKPGDFLTIRQGAYVASSPLIIGAMPGTKEKPIVIRAYKDEQVSIDGILPTRNFHKLNSGEWVRAQEIDPNAHADEYVSKVKFALGDPVNQGSFIDAQPYTRLITYHRLEDLRATSETFDRLLPGDPREGPEVMEDCASSNTDCVPDPNDSDGKLYQLAGYRHPWVYMGPGIYFNDKSGRIHIRLSHTHNNISGLTDYTGETDPNKVRLAIANQGMNTLQVQNSSYIYFQNLSLRFGGNDTLHLTGVQGLVFDHVRILAARFGVRMGDTNINTKFSNCEINGGLPSWYFRSDRKNSYHFSDGNTAPVNGLGGGTSVALLLGSNGDVGTTIDHCEFLNAHDMYLIGTNLVFHHNLVHNLNDEGMFLDGGLTANVKIYQNVITNVLNAISFAGECPDNQPNGDKCVKTIGGSRYIYRNLIDLRGPTAGIRPRCSVSTKTCDKNDVWRFGNPTKSNHPDGPYDLFQNTFLVYKQIGQASFLHYANTNRLDLGFANYRRRSLNNIFVAVTPDVDSEIAMAYLPPAKFPAITDGNDYFRLRIRFTTTPPLFRLKPPCGLIECKFKDLAELHSSCPSPYCAFEANSIEKDPQFKDIAADGVLRARDDLRLSSLSPAIGAGVKLPEDLYKLDPLRSEQPDIGCYRFDSDPLQVGVEGRRSYPN
jgi:hypothetical protein